MNEYETRQFWELKPIHNYPIWNVIYDEKTESFKASLSFDVYNIPAEKQTNNKTLKFKCNEI